MFLPSKILKYKTSRLLSRNFNLPINLTVSVTFRCNSRCKTCHIYEKKIDELSLREFENIFKSMGRAPYWITFSGGEVFLRNDFVEICRAAYRHCKPKIITIPTNAFLYQAIPEAIKEISYILENAKIVVNVSIDEVGERHDNIRGLSGSFKNALVTYNNLRNLNLPNLVLGVHTVISKFNVKRIPQIYNFVMGELKPDSYITEIAEQRQELNTVGLDIAPSLEDYTQAIDFLSREIRKIKFRGLSRITEAFRLNYYDMVKRILRNKKQFINCYAGIASCHIAPNGDVWACCVKTAKMGNLREPNYDFKKVWLSEEANKIRKEIRDSHCFCPLANASYTNMLLDLTSLLKVCAKAYLLRL